MRTRLIRITVAYAATLLLAMPSFADMKAFNAAVKMGDYKTAAAEAKSTWATWDKTDRDTAIVAREFGFAAYVAGDYAAARDFGQFLKDNGPSLPVPDDQPATSAVLFAAANYRLDASDKMRGGLVIALMARERAAGLDNVSVLASEALYHADWTSGKWARAEESGTLAANLLSRGGEQLAPRALEARGTAAAAGFLRGRDKGDYAKLADAHDAVIDAINDATDPKKRASLIPLKFQLQAWTEAVALYFKASDQIGSNIPKDVKTRALKVEARPLFENQTPKTLVCPGMLRAPDMHYPSSAIFKGAVGAVIMKVDFDANGRVVKGETLAAVPARSFAETVEKGLPQMYFERDKDDPPGCTLEATARVITFIFRIL